MQASSLLIATDFSDEAGFAARRAAALCGEAAARAELVHVLPGSLPAALHLGAASRAQQALAVVAAELAAQGLPAEPRLVSGTVAAELARAAEAHDLVIAGARGVDVLRDFALGRTSLHLVRESRRPTLIVKRAPAGAYRRALLATDFSAPALAAALCATRLAPQASFELVHAFEVEFESSLRLAAVDQEKIEHYRREARERALAAIEEFAGRLGLERARVSMTVSHGYPPRVIREAAARSDAELVVVGKHAAGRLEHALIGSVALQVLESAPCDVLVVPEGAA